MDRSDEHHVSESVRDHLHSAEDEGPHQDLAQLAVGLHQRQQLVAVDLDHLAGLAGDCAVERAPPRKRADLAGELSRSMDRYQLFGIARGAENFYATCDDDE